jgi:LuxR family quorum-sensing system transcriptional regulator CciR
MLSFQDVNDFLSAFQSATSEDDLRNALSRATQTIGFRQVAMGHHVDLAGPPMEAIRISTYNKDWTDHVVERRYFADDPVHIASTKTVTGFSWSELDQLITLTPRHKQILAEAYGFGLGAGFTVPVHLPGEYHGTCSFAAASTDDLHDNALPVAQLCGSFAFECARRIMKRKLNLDEGTVPSLTPRQLEALVWVGRGKTDGEIGQILGVSRATAHEHVEGVRRAYGNAQRAYLIVRALFDGQIAFADLLRR